MHKSHTHWIQKTIEQAKLGRTPFGAVLVKSTKQYISAFNTTKKDGPQAHAEMNVIKQINKLKPYNSKDLKLYSTVEPCPMCMSALIWAGVGQLIYGANIDDAAQYGDQIHIYSQSVAKESWYSIDIISGIERTACLELFQR